MLRFLLYLCALSCTACAASRQHFIPREDVSAQSPRGWPAAQYPLTIGGENVGEVKVWSEGTYRGDVESDDDKRTILHVGFEVENRTRAKLTFDVDACKVVDAEGDDGFFSDMAPHRETGKLEVAAGQVGLIDFEFVLPRDTYPRDLDTFRVEWKVTNDKGEFRQSTPFRVDVTRYYRPRYYGYDWGYGPWWGFGTGFAAGRFSSYWFWGPRWGPWCW